MKKIAVTSSICCIMILITFIFALYRGINIGMPQNPSSWVVNSIPFALSNITLNTDKYIANADVTDAFLHGSSTKSYNAGIDEVLQLSTIKSSGNIQLWGDDKGIIDFVSMAFRIFGFKIENIYYFYFTILFVSSFIYLIANFNSISRLIVLLQYLIIIYLILPTVRFDEQLVSLIAPRAFPVLSIIPALHCIFYALQPKPSIRQIILLAIQIIIILFTVHLRITAYWQCICIAAVCLGSTAIRFYKKRFNETQSTKYNLQPLLPILFLLIGLWGLKEYRQAVFPEIYKTKDAPQTRTFWHNILSGLAFDPELAKRYSLKVDDRTVYNLVYAYPLKNKRSITGDLSYDLSARDTFISICKKYPLQCFRTAFYYKPLSAIKNIGWAYGFRKIPADLDVYVSIYDPILDWVKIKIIKTSHQLDENNLRAYLWTPKALLALLMPVLLLFLYPLDFVVLWGVFLFAVSSLIPSIIGHPGTHTITDAIVSVGVLIYSFFITVIYKLYFAIRRVCSNAVWKDKLGYC